MEYLHDGSNGKGTENDPEDLHRPDRSLFSNLHIPFIINTICHLSLYQVHQHDSDDESNFNKEGCVKFYGVPENKEQRKGNASEYKIEGIFFHAVTLF